MRKLRIVPHAAILELGGLTLDPRSSASVTAPAPGKLRVVDARLAADFLHSRVGQQVRRWIPGARWLLRGYDSYQREHATSLARIDHVTIDERSKRLNQLDELPLARQGHEISVHVTNTGTRSLAVRICVEVEL